MPRRYQRKDQVKQLLIDYPSIKRQINQIEMGYIYAVGVHEGGGRPSGIGRPTEQRSLNMAADTDLAYLRQQAAAVEKLMERIAAYNEPKRSEHIKMIRYIYTDRLSADEAAARIGLSVKTIRARNRAMLEYLAGIMAAMGV